MDLGLPQTVLGYPTTLKKGHLDKQDTFTVPNAIFVGHLTNQDTLFCPKSARIREVPLNTFFLVFILSRQPVEVQWVNSLRSYS